MIFFRAFRFWKFRIWIISFFRGSSLGSNFLLFRFLVFFFLFMEFDFIFICGSMGGLGMGVGMADCFVGFILFRGEFCDIDVVWVVRVFIFFCIWVSICFWIFIWVLSWFCSCMEFSFVGIGWEVSRFWFCFSCVC